MKKILTDVWFAAAVVMIIVAALVMTGCSTGLSVLDGATHACGNVHLEGYFTDTQGDVIIAKAPADWTPEQVASFCKPE